MKIIRLLFFNLLFLFISTLSASALTISKHWEGNLNISLGKQTHIDTQLTSATGEQISNFLSEITINNDTSISVKETIAYETPVPHHGIYRYIPTKYNRSGLSYKALVKHMKITDENGRSQPFSSSIENGYLTYKIGDPKTTFTGKKTYILSYTVDNALQRYEKYDELYWDITGEGWKIPVLKSRASVSSPNATINAVVCYTGPSGQDDKQCNYGSTPEIGNFYYNKSINYGDNFTVAVALSQNSNIQFPSTTQRITKTLVDNSWSLVGILPALVMFVLWYKKGRDWRFISPDVFNLDPNQPQELTPIIHSDRTPFVYEPLKELTPGEAGTILDEQTNNQDVVAEIIDLARKKYLKIEAVETKGILGIGTNRDYRFTKLKNVDSSLPTHQSYLFTHLFNNTEEILLSKLKGDFHKEMNEVKSLINKSLSEKQIFSRIKSVNRSLSLDTLKGGSLFSANPQTVRLTYMVGVLAVSIILLAIIFPIILTQTLSPLVYILGIPSIALAFIFAYQMPQRTAIGTNYRLQSKGLQQTIKRGSWREKVKEKHLFIEEVLPFAISLGVVKQLAKDMEALNLQPPSYFAGVYQSNMMFHSFVSSFNSQVSSNLSYNPSSSSWSGGSGFSGGSSGGGGGGGGGGSW